MAFQTLNQETLLSLAGKLERDPAMFPPTASALFNYVSTRQGRTALAAAFTELAEKGVGAAGAAWMLRTIVEERRAAIERAPKATPVWSGLDREGASQRSLAVLDDLFREAEYRVWISTYNIDYWRKSKAFLTELAERLDRGELEVRIYLNIRVVVGKSNTQSLDIFRSNFKKRVWPGDKKLPEVYYDPRALDDEGSTLSCLHAKMVMVDTKKVLITSANFSEAAQIRNIEAGVVVEDQTVTETYCRNFQRLVEEGLLVRLEFGEE